VSFKLGRCVSTVLIFCKMLLANRFLTGGEVAKVLKHYERHTGMEFWYD
jgi:hypothetical protein